MQGAPSGAPCVESLVSRGSGGQETEVLTVEK